MLNAIIFDLDQTLLDRTATFKHFLENQYLRFQADLGSLSSSDYVANIQRHDNNGYTPKDEVYAQVCDEWSLSVQKKLLDDFTESYGQEPILFNGALLVLETLSKRYKVGLITNGRTKGQNVKIDNAGIRKYFSAIKISQEEGVKKPSPIIFERCLKQLDVDAEKAVYIGDHPEKDIAAAQKVGLKGIWVRNHRYDPPETADGIIDDLSELIDLLPSLQFN